MAEALTPKAWLLLAQRLEQLPVRARRLLCLIVQQAFHGTLRCKAAGRATLPEVHEACGLDVDELQSLMDVLVNAHFISLKGCYPFEEIQLAGEHDTRIWETMLNRCDSTGTRLENVLVNIHFERMFDS